MKSILLALCIMSAGSLCAQELVLKITNPHVNGTQVTYDVSTDYFTEMISTQYSIQYDTSLLSFVAIENINLSDMSLANFNTNIPGAILNSWYQSFFEPVTLSNGSVLFQIVFEMQSGTPGSVCFSEDPLQSEFAQSGEELLSFSVVDDCHPLPYQISLVVSGTEILESQPSLRIDPVIQSQKIFFTVDVEQAVEFQVFNLTGTPIAFIPKTIYSAGNHTIDLPQSMIPGLYVLTTREDTFRIIKQ